MFWHLLHCLEKTPRSGRCQTTPVLLTSMMRRRINHTDINLRRSTDASVDYNTVVISGSHDSTAQDQQDASIEIIMHFHPAQHTLHYSELDWPQLALDLAECVGHELVHRSQHVRKKKKLKAYASEHRDPVIKRHQEYLGHEQEIEAYGFSIAAQLAAGHSCFEFDPHTAQQVDMYNMYTDVFDHDQSIVLQLHTQISKYLRRLEITHNDQTNSRSRHSRH